LLLGVLAGSEASTQNCTLLLYFKLAAQAHEVLCLFSIETRSG
jgi:hypothetical protein